MYIMLHVETFSVSDERKYEDHSKVFFLPEYLLIFKTFFKWNVSQGQNVKEVVPLERPGLRHQPLRVKIITVPIFLIGVKNWVAHRKQKPNSNSLLLLAGKV
jgi:hypothetical protein